MLHTAARATLLALFLTLALSANHLINDHIISPRASELIEKIGSELQSKTGIHAYALATNDSLPAGTSLYEYLEGYATRLQKPYVVFLFAPNSHRIGLIPSDEALKKFYDPSRVKHYAIAIVSSMDKNSLQSKYDVAVVQAYSELADEIASAKGIELKSTIKNDSVWFIKIITWIVYLGAILIFWVYFGRPIYQRIRHGRR